VGDILPCPLGLVAFLVVHLAYVAAAHRFKLADTMPYRCHQRAIGPGAGCHKEPWPDHPGLYDFE